MIPVKEGQTYYLAGPMSGIPQFNIPLFDQVSGKLRGMGYTIISPAELDDPVTRKAALASPDGAPGSGSTNGETWGDFLSRDVKLVADKITGIIFLPDWTKSRGAKLEAFVGLLTGKQFAIWNVVCPSMTTPDSVRELLRKSMP